MKAQFICYFFQGIAKSKMRNFDKFITSCLILSFRFCKKTIQCGSTRNSLNLRNFTDLICFTESALNISYKLFPAKDDLTDKFFSGTLPWFYHTICYKCSVHLASLISVLCKLTKNPVN